MSIRSPFVDGFFAACQDAYIRSYHTGWWCGTFFVFPYTVLARITSQLTFIFFRGVGFNHQPASISQLMGGSLHCSPWCPSKCPQEALHVALRAGGSAAADPAGIAAELAEEKSRLCCGGTGGPQLCSWW